MKIYYYSSLLKNKVISFLTPLLLSGHCPLLSLPFEAKLLQRPVSIVSNPPTHLSPHASSLTPWSHPVRLVSTHNSPKTSPADVTSGLALLNPLDSAQEHVMLWAALFCMFPKLHKLCFSFSFLAGSHQIPSSSLISNSAVLHI